ncbi:MAG: AraC family transcriptional regulator [Fibrobacterales bacterium]
MKSTAEKYYASTLLTGIVLEYLKGCGVMDEAIVEATGKPCAYFRASDEYLTVYEEMGLWEKACILTNNIHAGIDIGLMTTPEGLGVVGYLCLQRPTVKDALETYAQYHKILQEGVRLDIVTGGIDAFYHSIEIPHFEPPQSINEMVVAATWSIIASVTSIPTQLLEVHFINDQPHSTDKLLSVFGKSIVLKFNQKRNGLLYQGGSFSTALKNPNTSLADILQQHAQVTLQTRSPKELSLTEKIEQYIMEEIHQSDITISSVAGNLGIGVRTLQRELKEEGVVFKQIVEDSRKSLAEGYLKKGDLSIAEIAFLLGFSEPGVFTRAFKRWFHCAPKEYRKEYLP